MAIAVQPPKGGIVAEIGGKERKLLLRNREIERFETQHGVGIFAILDQLLGRAGTIQARHVRDLVALGLVGGGMPDRAADDIVSDLGPSANYLLRQVALDMLIVAFTPENPQKKSDGDGSSPSLNETATSSTSPDASEVSPEQGSSPKRSETSPRATSPSSLKGGTKAKAGASRKPPQPKNTRS